MEVDVIVMENIKFLEEWLDNAKSKAEEIKMLAQAKSGISIFSIATTSKIPIDNKPYFTPEREVSNGYIGGCVVFSQTQAILVCNVIDGIVDYILVDAEKKLPISFEINEEVYKYFGIDIVKKNELARVHIELGNLSKSCQAFIKKSIFHEFKPNDITVDSIWHFISNRFKVLSGKKAAIIGAGNIGFKIALKLVESGCETELYRRDYWKGTQIVDTINIIKPVSTVAKAYFNSDPLQASLFSDILIGVSSGVQVITWKMIQSMSKNGVIVDVGKGTIYPDAISRALEKNITLFRTDVTPGMDGMVATLSRTKKNIEHEMGRLEIPGGVFIVSGGIIGKRGDVVVDNINNPSRIIGVADGCGDWLKSLSGKHESSYNTVKEYIAKRERA